MAFWFGLLFLLVLLAAIGIPLMFRRAAAERKMVERRLTVGNSDKDDARLLTMKFGDLFNDPERIRKHLEKDNEVALAMWQAGFRSNNQRAMLFGVQVILPLVIAISAALWLLFKGMSQNNLLIAVGIVIAGLLLPKKIILGIAEARIKRINDELSLFMQMLRILFDSGLAVEQSLRVMASDGARVVPELVKELDPPLRRAEQGLDLEQELSVTASFLKHAGFTDVVVILRQMLKQGGSARASLAKMIEVMDSRRLTDMQEKVSKLSAKMTVVMVVFFFPALIILLAGPGFMSIGDALGSL